MKFKTYNYSDLDSIIFELMNNKAVIIPTDTIVGMLARDKNVIYKIKQRDQSKKIVQFITNLNSIKNLDEKQKEFLEKFWPGGMTAIKSGIAYRIPNESHLLYILNHFDHLYCSSANISNHDCINHPIDANKHFDINKNFYNLVIVDEPSIGSSIPSTLVDIDKWTILRRGDGVYEIEKWINKNFANKHKRFILLVEESEYSFFYRAFVRDKKINIMKLNSKSFKALLDNFDFTNDLLVVSHEPDVWDLEANKYKHIRSGIVYAHELSELIKLHDDVQVANFDLNLFSNDQIVAQIQTYIKTDFEGGRHLERVKTIIDYENNQ